MRTLAVVLFLSLCQNLVAAPPPTHYETLGADPRASLADIRRAYRHKRRLSENEAAPDDTLKAIDEAFRVLGNFAERTAYDRKNNLPGPAVQSPYATSFRVASDPVLFAGQLLRALKQRELNQGEFERDPSIPSELAVADLRRLIEQLKAGAGNATWQTVVKILEGNPSRSVTSEFIHLVAREFLFSEPPVRDFLYFMDTAWTVGALSEKVRREMVEEYLSQLEFREEYLRVLSMCFVFLQPNTGEVANSKVLVKHLYDANLLPKQKEGGEKDRTAVLVQNALTVMGTTPSAVGEYLAMITAQLSLQFPQSQSAKNYADSAKYQASLLINLLKDLHELSSLRALEVLLQPEHTQHLAGSWGGEITNEIDSAIFEIVSHKTHLESDARERPLLLQSLARAETFQNCLNLLRKGPTETAPWKPSDFYTDSVAWSQLEALLHKGIGRPGT